MSETKNLFGAQAAQKIKELAEKASTCLFITNLTQLPLSDRPMSTLKVDEDGYIWFFSKNDSEKNEDILMDNRVQLFYANPASSEFLSVYGTAKVIKDVQKTEELWNAFAKVYFEGKDDPTLTIIKVSPQEGHYWDNKNGKVIQLLKIMAGAITGKRMDDGLEGDLNPGQPGNA